MADRVVPGPVDSSACVREAVCIHTKKIYSSCRDKDCVEDLRVFPTRTSQGYIENAFSIRPKSAELLYAGVNVEEITFNRGYYTVDVTYFYRVSGECVPNAKTVTGLCVFNKRVILFGSEGSVKVYTSDGEITTQADQPVGVVEAVDPIALSIGTEERNRCCCQCCGVGEIRDNVCAFVDGMLTDGRDGCKRLFVTLGFFSVIRIERPGQYLINATEYSVPEKECVSGDEEDPCAVFEKMAFPVNEFSPPPYR